ARADAGDGHQSAGRRNDPRAARADDPDACPAQGEPAGGLPKTGSEAGPARLNFANAGRGRHNGAPVHRLSRPRLALFAFGDFAFNLFWQSIMLYLLFYYTDALELPIALAATTYMVASVWDGVANFAAGALVD